MDFNEIKINNRLQIECESENTAMRNVKGIVLQVDDGELILVTDFGELASIPEDKVLSITKINFDKIVSDSLTDVKNHYNEIYELTNKIKQLQSNEKNLKETLYDANFLAKFNIVGAKNRIENSIDNSLFSFKRDVLTFKTSFSSNPNSQIELNIQVFNTFEYYNLDEIGDVDKIIRIHAPNVKDEIKKSFSFNSKVHELDKKVVHEQDSIYSVSTLYKLYIDVTQENFLQVRDEIINGLNKLKKY
ncbi:MAG: hypothetical protein K0R54_599 [Clostridiaceae bacterium]|nr:hypothetical protein [Clostridiaceae bacterium]